MSVCYSSIHDTWLILQQQQQQQQHVFSAEICEH
jgi:hypothetical protein